MITRRGAVGALAAAAANTGVPAIRLLLGGDVMLSRWVGRLSRMKQDPGWPFREIAAEMAAADIAFCNLESPFSEKGPPYNTGMVFKAMPSMIEGLVLAGIDVVSTANNHALDCGEPGLLFTLDWLARHGIEAVGTARTAADLRLGRVLYRRGVRFGFLAYTYDQRNGIPGDDDVRIAGLDAAAMQADVRSMLSRADAIIVSMHAGTEYAPKPTRQQIEFARAAIDAGATVVAGHHPHVRQPVEAYREGVIFYSLGNLVFDQNHRVETRTGAMAEVHFEGRKLRDWVLKDVNIVNTQPHWAAPPNAKQRLRQLR